MKDKNIYRTHTCNELRIENVGEWVTLSGWINSVRKLGGIAFVTLRDHYGITQILFKNEALMENVCKETVVKVTGQVVERQSKNPKMPTGDIEVLAVSLETLGKCQSVLPFEISDAPNIKEELRLKYRYLDLRNPELHSRIVKRAEILKYVREKMNELGFVEFQTPVLANSSPEGARDFIVPTISAPGEFYALPQSPQQFKQLLMISGFDRYFQIAPCFRNEAARADRTPGEFYQIDFEMSFATQDDVFHVAEEVAFGIYNKFTTFDITKPPFVRIPWKKSMELYSSDKPDLRNPLIVNDITKLFKNTQFSMFSGKTIKAIKAHTGEKSRKFYDELSQYVVKLEGKGLAWAKFISGEFSGSFVKFISEKEKQNLLKTLDVKEGESIFIVADTVEKAAKIAGVLRNEIGAKLDLIDKNKVCFCWIYDFPFYEPNDETGKPDFAHNPFSMPQGGLNALLNKNPFEILAYQYDLVCNGYEMVSGAIRNHDPETMVKAFEIAGYPSDVVENKFPALFNAFHYGAPPHAGAAFGFDRMLMPIMEQESIREVIAFPLNKNGRDLLMGSPNFVTEKQLKDVGIKLDLKN
jgi:aspartyl-tRNA synthetase